MVVSTSTHITSYHFLTNMLLCLEYEPKAISVLQTERTNFIQWLAGNVRISHRMTTEKGIKRKNTRNSNLMMAISLESTRTATARASNCRDGNTSIFQEAVAIGGASIVDDPKDGRSHPFFWAYSI